MANAAMARSLAPRSKLLACVKADAYGHGLAAVSLALEDEVDALGVACVEEAAQLRACGVASPILLMEGGFNADDLDEAQSLGCWIVIHNHDQLQTFLKHPLAPAKIWIKIDSGMHRLGFHPSEISDVWQKLQSASDHSELLFMTHFACADELQNNFTQTQLQIFKEATDQFGVQTSMANSAAVLAWPDTHTDWNRPGFMLYGVNPLDGETERTTELQAAMTLSSSVMAVKNLRQGEGVGYNHAWRASKDCRIAVVACGYGDGYPRQLRNSTPVLVKGKRAESVGHVAMDMMTIDVSRLDHVKVGDQVELWGPNLSIKEVASHSDMSPYELMTRVTSRPERCYLNRVNK